MEAPPQLVLDGSVTLAWSLPDENSAYAAIENRSRTSFGLQFHPEVAHTPRGKEIIANFVHSICGCGKNWTMRSYMYSATAVTGRSLNPERRLTAWYGIS